MNKAQALLAAIGGAKIRLPHWRESEFIEYRDDGFLDEKGVRVAVNYVGDGRDDWQLFGEAEPEPEPEFTCKYCGSPSYVDPSDQSPPPGYCHEADHGEPEPESGQFATVLIPFGEGRAWLTRGHTEHGYVIGIEVAEEAGPIGEVRPLDLAEFSPAVMLAFPTEEARDRAFQAFGPPEEQPEEHAFAYFVSGPNCQILLYPEEVDAVIQSYGGDPDEYTATALVPQAPRTHTGGMPGLGPNEVPVAAAPKYIGPAIPDTLAHYVQNLAASVEWAPGNHRVVMDMVVQDTGWYLDGGAVYSFGEEPRPKLHAKLPDKPDCEAAFKNWYWTYGADFNATHVRPVWMAAQHAMYEALKEQLS